MAIPYLTEYNDKYQAVHYRILTSNNKSILEIKNCLSSIKKINKLKMLMSGKAMCDFPRFTRLLVNLQVYQWNIFKSVIMRKNLSLIENGFFKILPVHFNTSSWRGHNAEQAEPRKNSKQIRNLNCYLKLSFQLLSFGITFT